MSTAHSRRPTNLSLPPELVEEARSLGVNLSRELSASLAEIVSRARAIRWREENEKAIAAYETYVEKHGIWNEDSRGW